VDNGWLAAALMVVRNVEPSVRDKAQNLLHAMNFGFYYDPAARGANYPAGELRGGFYPDKPTGCSVPGNYVGPGPDVYYTCNHYDILNTEPRIATYIGIAMGQILAKGYFGTNRTFPDTCDWAWLKQQPTGVQQNYLGVSVYEGTYQYRGDHFVPTWGGDMFEAMVPNLFVPEEQWGPNSWGLNHPAYVRGQIEHGMDEADYGYWGFSPASNPYGGYGAYGAPPLGMSPDGYPSDLQGSKVDYGFGSCRPVRRRRPGVTGSSRRMPRSSLFVTHHRKRWRTSRSCGRTSRCTARADSRIPSRCAAARSRTGTWRWTRA
jgi:hypothetical protein